MTSYEKELIRQVEERHGELAAGPLLEKLMEMGVVDYTRCKVLSVREAVHELTRQGMKKTDAMWAAAERFCCSYEYVRKCMYYYNDVNLC